MYYHFVMFTIQEIIKVLINRKGTSMNKVLKEMKAQGYDVPAPSNISAKFKNKTIKYRLVEEILDYLGYKIEIKEK